MGYAPLDLPFELLLDAAQTIVRRHEPANADTLTRYLRSHGSLRSGEHVLNFYSDHAIRDAISAAQTRNIDDVAVAPTV